MSSTRLNKYIAAAGICSRRKADELIESGVVIVNNKRITELGYLVGEKDKVFINNKLIHPVKHQYYRFFKPAGYITTSDDEKGRRTIYDILPQELWGLKPVGRLDKDYTGLLILTNDGDLINELTHPSVKIAKVYLVSVNKAVSPHELEQMANGIAIEKGKIAYADIQVLEVDKSRTMMRITLYQGMNRQIRKMFEYFGYEVKSLKRIQHATIQLEGLKRGEWKPIKPKQIKELRNFINRIEQIKND